MPALSHSRTMLLQQLWEGQLSSTSAFGRIAAQHLGEPNGLQPFRSSSVTAGEQHFPRAEVLEFLIARLLVRVRLLFAESRDAIDDFHVAGFLLWGLMAIHPFSNGNGRTSVDFVQYVLMTRWRCSSPPLLDVAPLLPQLVPVFRQIEGDNDGSAEGHLKQLKTLTGSFQSASLDALRQHEQFGLIARVLSSLTAREAEQD